MQYKTFVFSPFQENTYILYDETLKCVIIDPGNFNEEENNIIDSFISDNGLTPVAIIQTHNHLDHLFGTYYVTKTYNIGLQCHADDVFWIEHFKDTCEGYGIAITNMPPKPKKLIDENSIIEFGNTKLQVLHVPGHSPGGIAFYNADDKVLFCGDILFAGSIGRTDLPGGNYEQLITGIKTKLLTLPDDTIVLPGHGEKTTISKEQKNNPFLS